MAGATLWHSRHPGRFDERPAIPIADLIGQVLDDLAPDAEALGCIDEIERCRTIAGAGTSADAQLAVFAAHEKSANRDRALDAVTDCW